MLEAHESIIKVYSLMEYHFNADEFTTRDLITYLNQAYGCQVNGNSFSQRNIEDWIGLGHLPEAYGGNKILKVESITLLNDLRVLTIEHLNRYDIQEVFGYFDQFKSTLQKEKAKLDKRSRIKRQRTELYYQIAGSRTGSKVAKANALPNNWKEQGIKGNQIASKKKK